MQALLMYVSLTLGLLVLATVPSSEATASLVASDAVVPESVELELSAETETSILERAFRPTFFMHGIGAKGQDGNAIRDHLAHTQPGFSSQIDWIPIDIMEETPWSWWDWGKNEHGSQMLYQVKRVIQFIEQKIGSNPGLFKDGYNLVCHSQGGLVCRGVIETWDGHNVKAFVSLAGPQQGLTDYKSIVGNVENWDAPRGLNPAKKIAKAALQHGLQDAIMYDSNMQKQVSFAGYMKMPEIYSRYQVQSKFLSIINNEFPEHNTCPQGLAAITSCGPGCKACGTDCGLFELAKCIPMDKYNKTPRFKTNFKRLQAAVFLGSETDGEIIPWQSTTFGYWEGRTQSKVVPYQSTTLGKKNLLPLGEMLQTKCSSLTTCARIVAFQKSPCKNNPADGTPGFKCVQLQKPIKHNSFTSAYHQKHLVAQYVDYLKRR